MEKQHPSFRANSHLITIPWDKEQEADLGFTGVGTRWKARVHKDHVRVAWPIELLGLSASHPSPTRVRSELTTGARWF